MMMYELRILVIDGSAMYRKMFAQASAELKENAAVTSVTTGEEASSIIRRNNYDIVVIDAETQRLDKLLAEIALELPKAFVLLTARPSKTNDAICSKALDRGASDCLVKPIYSSYNENFDVIKQKMTGIFEAVHLRREMKPEPTGRDIEKIEKAKKRSSFRPEIVLIAASTGGPLALDKILSNLNGAFPVPIIIVQHMLMHFTNNLAQNLNIKSQLRIKIAENEEYFEAGTVYIAPGGTHIRVDAENKFRLDDSPPINGVRPAADVLFKSVAESFAGTGVLTVILTGMGRDGEKGLAVLKEKKDCFCVAQSEETCVVYGMPRVAIESGLADKVLDLDEIPFELESFDYESYK